MGPRGTFYNLTNFYFYFFMRMWSTIEYFGKYFQRHS